MGLLLKYYLLLSIFRVTMERKTGKSTNTESESKNQSDEDYKSELKKNSRTFTKLKKKEFDN